MPLLFFSCSVCLKIYDLNLNWHLKIVKDAKVNDIIKIQNSDKKKFILKIISNSRTGTE